MSKFWIDFQGYCAVDADTKEQAETIFWDNILPMNQNLLYDWSYEVECIEEETHCKQLSMFDAD